MDIVHGKDLIRDGIAPSGESREGEHRHWRRTIARELLDNLLHSAKLEREKIEIFIHASRCVMRGEGSTTGLSIE